MNKDYEELRTSLTWTPTDVSGRAKAAFSLTKKVMKKQGADDAGNGQPPSDSTEQYGVQRDVFTQAEEAARNLASRFQDDKEKSRNSLQKSCSVDPISTADDAAFANAQQEAKNLTRKNDTTLVSAREGYWRSTIAMNKFKADNDLFRPADYPDAQIWNAGLILLALAIETIVNGNMFAAVSDGLISGWGRALIFSVINIMLGAVLGFFGIRYLFHVNPIFKGIAGLFSIILVTLGVGWNLFVAHYREVAAESDGVSEMDAFARLLEAPFDLGSVEAIGLFLFGVIIFGIMGYKAFSGFADKYPGYANIDRKRLAAQHYYDDLEAETREDIEAIFEDEIDHLEETIRSQKQRANLADANMKVLHNQRDKVYKELDGIVRIGNDLLQTYRNIVTRVRNGVHVTHFSVRLSHDSIKANCSEEFDLEELSTLAKSIRENAENNRLVLEKHEGLLLEAEKTTFDEFDVWLQAVDRQAALRVDSGHNATAMDLLNANSETLTDVDNDDLGVGTKSS